MSISSVGGASALSQLYSAQQAQAAVSVDTPTDSLLSASAGQGGDSNALTGTTTSNLDSQTLQALLDLTQQDPSSSTDPSQASQTGQMQGAHHHHHHHGGMQAQAPTQSSTAAASDPSQTAAGDGDTEASPASVPKAA